MSRAFRRLSWSSSTMALAKVVLPAPGSPVSHKATGRSGSMGDGDSSEEAIAVDIVEMEIIQVCEADITVAE